MDFRFQAENVWKIWPHLQFTIHQAVRCELSGMGLYTGINYCIGFVPACVETDM